MKNVIQWEKLNEFCRQVCLKYGFTPEEARITAEVLTETDMMGTHSHGTKNLLGYIRKTEAGGIKTSTETRAIREGAAWAVLDGDAGMGMVASYRAMQLAIQKAKTYGIAFVNVRNSTHFGAAGYYACMAAKEGLIGISMGNTEPNMSIPGGRGREIGNSPFSIAFPQKSGYPLYLDIAMSTVAALKVEKARLSGEKIPDTWIVDKNGVPSVDPKDYAEGAAQPMAGHKGYGLSMAIEILTGVMGGGAILHEMRSWNHELAAPNGVSACMIAIDPACMTSFEDFEARLAQYTDALHSTPCREGNNEILVPGELETRRYQKALKFGIDLPQDVFESLQALSELSGIELPIENR